MRLSDSRIISMILKQPDLTLLRTSVLSHSRFHTLYMEEKLLEFRI